MTLATPLRYEDPERLWRRQVGQYLPLIEPTQTALQSALDARGFAAFDGTVTGTGNITIPDGGQLRGVSRQTSILSGIGIARSGTARIDFVEVSDLSITGAGLDFTGISTSSFARLYIESASGGFCIKGGSPDDDDTNDPCYYNGFEDIRFYAAGSGAKGIWLLALSNQNHFRNVSGGVDHTGGYGVYAENTAANNINGVLFDNFAVEGACAVAVKFVDAGNNLSGKVIDISFYKPRIELSGTTTAFQTTGHCKLGVMHDSMQVTRKYDLSTYTKLRAFPNAKTILVTGSDFGTINTQTSAYVTIAVADMGIREDFTTAVTVNPIGSGGNTLLAAGFVPTVVPYGNDNVRLYLTKVTTGNAAPGNFYAFIEVGAASDV